MRTMTKTYRLFRVYCLICIASLCALLAVTGFLTAKHQTEETVFNASYSTVRVYSSEENVVVNMAGKVFHFVPQKFIYIIEKAKPVIFAPVNNVIELAEAARGRGRRAVEPHG